MSDATSMTLLERLRTPRDGLAWERFVAIYQPLLEGWLRRQGVPADVIEDVRQEVLAKVHQEIAAFKHNGNTGAFRAWLRAILAHRLRTVLRRKFKEPQPAGEQLAAELADDQSLLSRQFHAEHDAYVVQRLLETIAPDFQEKTLTAFRRVVLEEQPPAAVAADLGMTVNSVRVAQCRVLAALRAVGAGLLDD